MEVKGYSERGVLNSLFYEIKYSENSLGCLNEFLSTVSFPFTNIDFRLKDANILIEQSFSDFGDADCVLAINNNQSKQSVFIEAKVKTFQPQCWSTEGEFERFKEGIEQNKVGSSKNKIRSNLFTQLYRKVRLIKALQKQNDGINSLKKGIEFANCISKTCSKIGNNEVVLKAVEILKDHCEDAFFIALVPDDVSNLEQFYENTLKHFGPNEFQEWDVRNWGYISWAEVEDFCKKHDLRETQKVFEFNGEQIYRKDKAASNDTF